MFWFIKERQSEDRWAEKFIDTALKSLQGSASYEQTQTRRRGYESPKCTKATLMASFFI